jgi:lipooligosaccharide transport system ATP-binding protein
MIMHEGQKVMQGHPKDLIRETIETFVLELIDPRAIAAFRRDRLPKEVRYEESQGVLRMYSDDLDAIKSLTGHLTGSHYYLRQSNLEDVFLKTTGRSLNVRQ